MYSFIITSHNEGVRLRKTVDSLLDNSDLEDSAELVLIDDAGTDKSFTFLEGSQEYRGIPVQRQRFDRSAGLVKARHYGATLANGDDLVFLDAHLAFTEGWLGKLEATRTRCGNNSAVTPNIAHLNEGKWEPMTPNGQVLWINRNLDMTWQSRDRPVPLVPAVLGCCWLISRELYFAIGGFDMGLTRWGCENIDIIAKLYAHGGACYVEESSVVGHLFRQQFPYTVESSDLLYSKMRIAYAHMPEDVFWHFMTRQKGNAAFEPARDSFLHHVSELKIIDSQLSAVRTRDKEWYWRTFLPEMLS